MLTTNPSDFQDPRFRITRSPHCPNAVTDQPEGPKPDKLRGTCGSCAWGFYSIDKRGPQEGEDPTDLDLVAIEGEEGVVAGYKAQCGSVVLYRDRSGRIGALRQVAGASRFFPGIVGNWAYERYLTRHPDLLTR